MCVYDCVGDFRQKKKKKKNMVYIQRRYNLFDRDLYMALFLYVNYKLIKTPLHVVEYKIYS